MSSQNFPKSLHQWWGKLIGSVLGYLVGGPWGALVGVVVGHAFDHREGGLHRFRASRGKVDFREFEDAVFALMGYLAKVDGRVTDAEIGAARQVMGQLGLEGERAERARQRFREGKEPSFSPEAAMRRARRICGKRSDQARILLEALVQVALAEGHVRASEQRVLEEVCRQLGFRRADLNQVIAIISAQQSRSSSDWQYRPPPRRRDVGTAYEVLGVNHKSSEEEIRQAYRRLLNRHHPDKIASSNPSPAMRKLAEEKTVEIRAAYDRIREARGMR